MKLIESWGKAKTVMQHSSNLIKKTLKEECYIFRLKRIARLKRVVQGLMQPQSGVEMNFSRSWYI
jgi:hypothetical protein